MEMHYFRERERDYIPYPTDCQEHSQFFRKTNMKCECKVKTEPKFSSEDNQDK